MIGPDDPNDAKISASESIRAQFGIDRINDVVYTSRSPLALTKVTFYDILTLKYIYIFVPSNGINKKKYQS